MSYHINTPQFLLGDQETTQAAAGTTQGTATTMNADHNWIGSVPALNNGVIFQQKAPNTVMSAFNGDSTNSMYVYPWSGAQFNNGSANAGLLVPAGRGVWCYVISATKIGAIY